MKRILGLDIGTNSIGWSLIESDITIQEGRILGIGSRILPMGGREKDFEAGTSVSKAADRRMARGARRLLQRYRLRRSRLIAVLKELKWLPENFPSDFKELERFNINDFIPFSESTLKEAKRYLGVTNKKGGETLLNDWVVYYLRTKALTKEISLQELARVIYHFNQRRGFKSSRKDNKDIDDSEEIKYPIREKRVEILQIKSIGESSEKSKYGKIFIVKAVTPEGEKIDATTIRKQKPDWENKEVELEITTITPKAGDSRVELRLPDRTDWEKMKVALEKDITESGLHPGEYHFNHLKSDRNYRIKERIIDRSFYIKELEAIWQTQAKFHPELNSKEKIPAIINLLYLHNEGKRKELTSKNLYQIISDDIIYYQRDLKSQKHLIGNCRYEKRIFNNKEGNFAEQKIKVVSKSHPSFQEFRIWQDIHNLRVLKLEEKQTNGRTLFDIEETTIYLTDETKAALFKVFDSRESVTTSAILRSLGLTDKTHRLNYPEEKIFKGNETKAKFRKVFRRHNYESEGEALMNERAKMELLWHINYSLHDEKNILSAVKKNFNFPDNLAQHIAKIPEFPSQYAAYSYKAINKLLPLMRCGEYWSEKAIHGETINRIEKIINAEYDENINAKTREEIAKRNFKTIKDFRGLSTFLACYVVYGRHSEKENEDKFESADEIKLIEYGELRNPIVEQVTNETLQLVKDIWKYYGKGAKDFIDEIHIELGRDLKNNAEERKKISEQNTKNEADRKRITAILNELRNANPDSIGDIERLRLWEETGNEDAKISFPKFSKEPTSKEIEKYKLWGEQDHISPYTGKVIPLSKLFSKDYQIEHIIPRARFFDDSFANKTICEAWVNSFKDNSTAMELINEYGGRELEHHGKKFKLYSSDDFIEHVRKYFRGKKKRMFLSESIPDGFVERQLNDTRYIGKKLSELLYPVAKDDVVFTSGNITSDLKEKWGLHRVWKGILKPRFERLEDITGEKLIDFDKEHNNIHFKKDYKRIDHRHHALDALIIAVTSRSHIQYLNTLNAQNSDKKEKQKYAYLVKAKVREFVLPWNSFTKDVREKLEETIVSHKNRTRIVTKGFNLFTKYVKDENGKWVKQVVKQEKGDLISVRKSMFQQPLGKVWIAEYKQKVKLASAIKIQLEFIQQHLSVWKSDKWRIAKTEQRKQINELLKNCEFDEKQTLKYIQENKLKDNKGNPIESLDLMRFNEMAAKRVPVNDSFDEKKIDKIPYATTHKSDKTLPNILKSHLKEMGSAKEAFSGEGMEQLTKKMGRPLNKVTTYEAIGNKIDFNGKLVEADKGSNLFFVIYENIKTGERIINEESSLPLLEVIAAKANKLPIATEKEGYRTIVLSPNDLVYVPEPEENVKTIDWSDKKRLARRIYKAVSFTKGSIFFVPHFVAKPLMETTELGANNKSESSWDEPKIMIKRVCIKVYIDRLGNIKPYDEKKA